MSGYAIREAGDGYAAAILDLHKAAFETGAESGLVGSLGEGGDIVLSLVAEHERAVVGSAVYSRLLINGENKGASALAPVGVRPDRQKRGIGSALIRAAHALLAERGERLVFVVGDPAYYRRFGFSAEAAASFRTPYDGPYLMALALDEDAAKGGVVTYAKAFAGLT